MLGRCVTRPAHTAALSSAYRRQRRRCPAAVAAVVAADDLGDGPGRARGPEIAPLTAGRSLERSAAPRGDRPAGGVVLTAAGEFPGPPTGGSSGRMTRQGKQPLKPRIHMNSMLGIHIEKW